MDVFQAMTLFRRVAEAGSFSAVAREQGLSQPTISKQVAQLEARLGLKLLSRSTRHLALTDVGRTYYERCVSILDDLQETEGSMQQAQSVPTGTLRVNAPASFARLHILPHLWGFMARHPDLKIDLMLDDHYVDLVREGVDLAIRVGPLHDSSLVARRLCASPRVTVASPDYLDKHGRPEKPSDLLQHQCVRYQLLTTGGEWPFQGPRGLEKIRVEGRFSADNPDAIRQAVKAGMGISIPPRWLVEDLLTSGELVELLPGYTPTPFDIHALWPDRRFVPSRVRLFVEFLQELLTTQNTARTTP